MGRDRLDAVLAPKGTKRDDRASERSRGGRSRFSRHEALSRGFRRRYRDGGGVIIAHARLINFGPDEKEAKRRFSRERVAREIRISETRGRSPFRSRRSTANGRRGVVPRGHGTPEIVRKNSRRSAPGEHGVRRGPARGFVVPQYLTRRPNPSHAESVRMLPGMGGGIRTWRTPRAYSSHDIHSILLDSYCFCNLSDATYRNGRRSPLRPWLHP